MFISRYITLTSCPDDDFTCKDGTCVSLEERCNGKMDCNDSSDEKDCTAIRIFPGYNKHLVPPPLGNDDSLLMNISINVDQIITVDENGGHFKTKITMIRRWINPQLSYLNLKRSIELNQIPKEDRERMWMPWMTYKNIDQADDIKVTDQNDIMMILPHSEFKFEKDGRSNIYNTRVFKGSENIIFYKRQSTVNWSCDYNMRWYPFDVQRCTMEMFPSSSSITLFPTMVTYSGPLNLPQHFVKGVNICTLIYNNRTGIVVEVYLGRPLFGTTLSVFLPTSILLILSQMVRIFGADHLEMVVEVNLTLLLVLATL